MKFLFIFAITFATVSASKLPNKEIKERFALVLPDIEDGKPIANLSVADHANYKVPANTEAEGRITNGQFAEKGQFPYQAYLAIRKPRKSSFCGGSLIGKNWVISAAHCTIKAESITVYLGGIARNSGEVKHTVGKNNIINHSGYNDFDLRNDISLVKIPTVTFSEGVQAIRLPSISKNYDSYAGYKAIASGWGRTERISDYLKWARMEVISNLKCFEGLGWPVSPAIVCTDTHGGISTCLGDSGGPLALESPKILIGVTSFVAERYCVSGYPAGFTRITSYLEWIKHHTGINYTDEL